MSNPWVQKSSQSVREILKVGQAAGDDSTGSIQKAKRSAQAFKADARAPKFCF
jgi:hypothetical protein